MCRRHTSKRAGARIKHCASRDVVARQKLYAAPTNLVALRTRSTIYSCRSNCSRRLKPAAQSEAACGRVCGLGDGKYSRSHRRRRTRDPITPPSGSTSTCRRHPAAGIQDEGRSGGVRRGSAAQKEECQVPCACRKAAVAIEHHTRRVEPRTNAAARHQLSNPGMCAARPSRASTLADCKTGGSVTDSRFWPRPSV